MREAYFSIALLSFGLESTLGSIGNTAYDSLLSSLGNIRKKSAEFSKRSSHVLKRP